MTGHRAKVEGAAKPAPKPTPALPTILDQAEALAGDKWSEIQTWPFASGLIFLAEKLKG